MIDPIKDLAAWLVSEWKQHFTVALQALAGQDVALSAGDAGVAGQAETWWRQDLQIDGACPIAIGARAEASQALGQELLARAGIEAPTAEDIDSTILEVLGQATAGLARSISARAGFEVTASTVSSVAHPATTAPEPFRVVVGDRTYAPFWIDVDPRAAQTIAGRLALAPQAGPKATDPADRGGSPASGAATMDLLLEVELPVSVSFGRAHLPLKDVIKLTTGSIVELNRTLAEPVEVIVNNCVIARGEVVVVDGNYGVRIHEIVSRQERLRTLS